MNKIIIIYSLLLISACTGKNKKESFSEANVAHQEGLYVFIEAEPTNAYDKIAEFKIGLLDKLLSLNDKSIQKVAQEIVSSFRFPQTLKNTVEEIKIKFPEANGIIFNHDLSSCSIIKFR